MSWLAKGCLILVASCWVGGLPVRAQANTDYRCLNNCVAQGSPASACLKSCRYDPAVLTNPGVARSTSHSQFTLRQPLGQAIQPSSGGGQTASPGTQARMLSPTTQPLGPSTNYKCQSLCLQNGFIGDYCRQSCSY